jgi:hypothetical protein
VLRERERARALLIKWVITICIYFTTFWPRVVAGVDKATVGARQRWAKVAAGGYSVVHVCLSLVVLGVWEMWEAYLLAIFPDEVWVRVVGIGLCQHALD